MVRLAMIDDITELQRMGQSFFNATRYNKISSYDPETMIDVFTGLIESGTLLTDGKYGMIGFIVFPLFFNKSDLIAQELFWWTDPVKRGTPLGIRLLKSAEKQAKELGAKAMLMLSIKGLKDDKLDSLYKRLGYDINEQSYMRYL